MLAHAVWDQRSGTLDKRSTSDRRRKLEEDCREPGGLVRTRGGLCQAKHCDRLNRPTQTGIHYNRERIMVQVNFRIKKIDILKLSKVVLL